MPKKIVIADDSATVVEIVRDALTNAGYDCYEANNGAEAWKLVKKEKPDLVILDVIMPQLNGYQVLRQIRSDLSLKDVHVVMLTAKDQESDRFWAKESGCSEYLTKPFDTEELLKKISGLLDKK